MIRKIEYLCSEKPSIYTAHSLFSKITEQGLKDLKVNMYSKQPEFKVLIQENAIVIIINTNDLSILSSLPSEYAFFNDDKKLIARLTKDEVFSVKSNLSLNDNVSIKGSIMLPRNITKLKIKDYLENKIGINIYKFNIKEHIDYIHHTKYKTSKNVYSKSNNNQLFIHNTIEFDFLAKVKNLDVINSLESTSIGRKRSYGFGNINIIKIGKI